MSASLRRFHAVLKGFVHRVASTIDLSRHFRPIRSRADADEAVRRGRESFMAAPRELRISKDRRTLTATFPDARFEYPAEMLRVLSPSAEVQGHSPEQRVTVGGKREVSITGAEAVGHYAVKLRFSDGHDTGIFTWSYLRALGTEKEARWNAYLTELADKKLTRG